MCSAWFNVIYPTMRFLHRTHILPPTQYTKCRTLNMRFCTLGTCILRTGCLLNQDWLIFMAIVPFEFSAEGVVHVISWLHYILSWLSMLCIFMGIKHRVEFLYFLFSLNIIVQISAHAAWVLCIIIHTNSGWPIVAFRCSLRSISDNHLQRDKLGGWLSVSQCILYGRNVLCLYHQLKSRSNQDPSPLFSKYAVCEFTYNHYLYIFILLFQLF